jgi:dTDP-4-dehydrorhamnose 3,5-epimerase
MTITYLVDGYYNGADECGVAWDDPAVEADWGLSDPILSERDQKNPHRSEIDPQFQPHISLRT